MKAHRLLTLVLTSAFSLFASTSGRATGGSDKMATEVPPATPVPALSPSPTPTPTPSPGATP